MYLVTFIKMENDSSFIYVNHHNCLKKSNAADDVMLKMDAILGRFIWNDGIISSLLIEKIDEMNQLIKKIFKLYIFE